ncbi:hypothetical protein QBC36DRAFT_198329 [Triangularia setosa]|uniref:Stress response RCI peptide n=1 Tax=Triangularia setosa TaxID=2587417 RepID=A0AAN6W188_9PEZI|nr:hypothetical protein QBC36DRAFT_198329 [Podospora setosa]
MSGSGFDGTAVFALASSFFCPPLAVALLAGCGTDVCINICLCLLGMVPGYIHAWYLVYVYLDNKKLSKQPEGGRPFVYSDKLQQISATNRSTASLPTPRTFTEAVTPHRRNPAVQQMLAQEQKPVPNTKPDTEKTLTSEPKPTTSARPTPVLTSGPSSELATGQEATQAPPSMPAPTPSFLPILDNPDEHSPNTKEQALPSKG